MLPTSYPDGSRRKPSSCCTMFCLGEEERTVIMCPYIIAVQMAVQIKNNISRFSGFVWHDNEEKQRLKVKEKLDKCVKEKLVELCDILDIPISRATSKKEDIVVKLLEFLVEPHPTTTVLLAEKDQPSKGKKRRRDTKGSSSRRSSKSRKKSDEADASADKGEEKGTAGSEDDTEDEEKEVKEGDKEENGVQGGSEDEGSEQSDSEEEKDKSQDEPEDDTKEAKKVSKKQPAKKEAPGKARDKKVATPNAPIPTSKRTPKKSFARHSKVDEGSDASPKVFSRKKKSEETTKEKISAPRRLSSKDKAGKKAVKGKEKTKESKVKPTDDDLRNAICDILKEVDFNTATFTDMLKQLAKQFNTDLTPRKSSIKLMIQEELTKLAEEDDEDEDEEAAGKEEAQPVAQQEVTA
ncbi:DEK domain-containing chromatin-associated protein 3-like protein [Drosera capensis]